MGLTVSRVKTQVYVAQCPLLAGLAGALNAARLSRRDHHPGSVWVLTLPRPLSSAAHCSSGAGSVIGTLSGVPLLGVIQNVINQIGSQLLVPVGGERCAPRCRGPHPDSAEPYPEAAMTIPTPEPRGW